MKSSGSERDGSGRPGDGPADAPVPPLVGDALHLANIAAGKKLIAIALGIAVGGYMLYSLVGGAAGLGLLRWPYLIGTFGIAIPLGFAGTALLINGMARYNGVRRP